MEASLIEAAASQGIWVLLFVFLFLYTIKNNEKLTVRQEERETNYQNIISELTDKFALISDVQNELSEIHTEVKNLTEVMVTK